MIRQWLYRLGDEASTPQLVVGFVLCLLAFCTLIIWLFARV